MSDFLTKFTKEEYCYLTTKGRKTGNPHEIEIWFVIHGDSLFLMSGSMDRSDWVRNLIQESKVTIKIADQTFNADARVVKDEAEENPVRELMAGKYKERESDGSLSEWAQTALVVGFKPNI